MAQHFVTVCVFCLLCATHTPCSSHTSFSNEGELHHNATDPNRQPFKKLLTEKTHLSDKPFVESPLSVNRAPLESVKVKRHARHHGVDEKLYLNKIFSMFGNGETMNFTEFENLVGFLALNRIDISRVNVSSVRDGASHAKIGNRLPSPENNTCVESKELISSVTNAHVDENSSARVIDGDVLQKLCPVLLYQVVAVSSKERGNCTLVHPPFGALESENFEQKSENNMVSVWLYSTLSIMAISACGLLGVAVIPFMQHRYYLHLLQFLVALAVGTLSGDAFLHLLPHSMTAEHSAEGSHHQQGSHDANMWKGFVAMLGVVFFFLMEKSLSLCYEFRKKRQRDDKLPSRVRVMRDAETDANSVGEKLCKHKYSSYPYCYDEIATETQDDHHQPPNNKAPISSNNSDDLYRSGVHAAVINEVDSDSENHILHKANSLNHNSVQITEASSETKPLKLLNHSESNKMLTENSDGSVDLPKNDLISESESYMVILREHENKHHGHTHMHGHVHSAPKTIASVAWMVIMGDGLHNFTDGMAIGAAFAASIPGGFSTVVAVFCHELPHELGDFAVLIKAGMSAKRAVFYNLISSVLCFLGMVFGVVLGNSETASSWVFAGAAGMFLYIALVDMMPELSSNHSDQGSSLFNCFLQVMGILTGLIIMLVIAMFEHDLKHIFPE